MPICHVFRSRKITLKSLDGRLRDLREPRRYDQVPGEEYVDRIKDVVIDGDKLRCVFVYHDLQEIRGEEEAAVRYFVVPRRVDFSVTDPPRENLWFIQGGRTESNVTARFIGHGLFGDVDAILNIELPTELLRELERTESIDLKGAKFRDVDAEVKAASLRGSLKSSPRFRAIKSEGQYTEIAYVSRSVRKRIRVAVSGRVSMTGVNVTINDLESYIEDEILSRL